MGRGSTWPERFRADLAGPKSQAISAGKSGNLSCSLIAAKSCRKARDRAHVSPETDSPVSSRNNRRRARLLRCRRTRSGDTSLLSAKVAACYRPHSIRKRRRGNRPISMPYSGPASAYGIIGKTMSAYFRMINDNGGVNGRRINFITYDDAYSPPKTVEQARKL